MMYDGKPDVGCPGISISLRNFYSYNMCLWILNWHPRFLNLQTRPTLNICEGYNNNFIPFSTHFIISSCTMVGMMGGFASGPIPRNCARSVEGEEVQAPQCDWGGIRTGDL